MRDLACHSWVNTAALTADGVLSRVFFTISASISLIGVLFLLFYFVRSEQLRTYPYIFILFLAFADLVLSIGILAQSLPALVLPVQDVTCSSMVAALTIAGAGGSASHLWITVYALNCLYSLGCFSFVKISFLEKWNLVLKIGVHVIIWPSAFIVGYYFASTLRDPINFLTITKDELDSWLGLASPQLVVWILNIVLFLVVCYLITSQRLAAASDPHYDETGSLVRAITLRLSFFILVYIVCWFAFFVTVILVYMDTQPPPWLNFIWELTLPLQGACNAVILGNSQVLRRAVRSDIDRLSRRANPSLCLTEALVASVEEIRHESVESVELSHHFPGMGWRWADEEASPLRP